MDAKKLVEVLKKYLTQDKIQGGLSEFVDSSMSIALKKNPKSSTLRCSLDMWDMTSFSSTVHWTLVIMITVLEALEKALIKSAIRDKVEIDRTNLMLMLIDLMYVAVDGVYSWGDNDYDAEKLFQIFQLYKVSDTLGWLPKEITDKLDIPADLLKVTKPIYKQYAEHKEEHKEKRKKAFNNTVIGKHYKEVAERYFTSK